MSKVYFAHSIRGAHFTGQEELYIRLKSAIREKDELASDEVNFPPMGLKTMTDISIYLRDTQWIKDSDLMVAEVSAPSLGIGYEICFAQLHVGIPVLCLHHDSANVSAMILGNKGLDIYAYDSMEHAIELLTNWLNLMREGRE